MPGFCCTLTYLICPGHNGLTEGLVEPAPGGRPALILFDRVEFPQGVFTVAVKVPVPGPLGTTVTVLPVVGPLMLMAPEADQATEELMPKLTWYVA